MHCVVYYNFRNTFVPYGHTIRYDTRCYFNVRSKANMSRLNIPHGTDNWLDIVDYTGEKTAQPDSVRYFILGI